MGLRLVTIERRDRGEGAGVRDDVCEKVDDHGCERVAAEDRERDRDVPHVGDSRIGEQAFDVALGQRDHVAEAHRQDGERGDRGAESIRHSGLEHGRQDPVEDDQARALGRDRQVGDGGRRHALVDVGRPRVERRERHLESETDQQKQEPERHERIRSQVGAREGGDPDAARLSEEERDPVERERRSERSGQEILQAGLRGGPDPSEERGQHVERERESFEADENHQQIEAARQEKDSEVSPEQQGVELALRLTDPLQVRSGGQDRDGRRRAGEESGRGGQVRRLVAAAEREARGSGDQEPHRDGDRGKRERRKGAARRRREGVEQDDETSGDGERDLGPRRGEIVRTEREETRRHRAIS